MQRTCLDIASISRYLNKAAELEDVLRVERHVARCARCRDKLIRMKRYSESLFDDFADSERREDVACPSSIQLQHFQRGSLNERQMVRVQGHLLRCSVCRTLVTTAKDAPGTDARYAFLATRQPDLDLRVAPQGIRIAAGGALLDDSTLPTLLQRLELRELAPAMPAVTTARQLGFARPVGGRMLRGRIELAGYEDFHLELQRWDDPNVEALQIWTREGSLRRFAADRRFRELLAPGHYFVGPSVFEPPWLALSFEHDFLTARGLAECGYDACCRGHFHAARRWFDDAVNLAPGDETYTQLLERVDEFARRFGLHDRDRPIRWRRRRRVGAAQPELRSELDDAPMLSSVDTVAELVLTLRRRVEEVQEGHDPLTQARFVSRRQFRSAFVDLMRWLQRHMGPPQGANPTSSAPR